MYLSKHDLLQMNDEWLEELPAEHLLKVSKRLLHDVKVLQDRQRGKGNGVIKVMGSDTITAILTTSPLTLLSRPT